MTRRRARRRLLVAVGAAAGAGTALLAARTALAYIEVRGDSMRPALADGDRLLVVRVPPRWVPRGGFVVGRMPREAAPPVLDPSREHLRDQYVRGKQFVKVLRAKPGDRVDGVAPRPLGKHAYWVEPLAPDAAGSRQWGPVHRDLLWGWAPLRGRLRVPASVAAPGPAAQDGGGVAGTRGGGAQ